MTISPLINTSASTLVKTATSSGTATSGVTFADFLQQKADQGIQALKNFETAAQASTHGQISELDLVHATNEADLQLQTFKTVWEKFLQKYETVIEKTAI